MHPNRWLAILGLLAANGAAAQPVTIEGSVRSPFFGTGVAGATVTVQRVTDLVGGGPVVATVTTDAGGLYTATFDGGCGLQCRIRAAADGRIVTPDLRILSAGGGGPQDFVAALPAVLNVRVEEFDGGAPVAGLRPFARYVDPTQSPVVEDLGGGRWRFSGVFPGQLHLCAQADDDVYVGTCNGDQVMPFTDLLSGVVPLLPAEGSTQDVVLRLRRGATLTGILTDSYRATPIRSTGFTLRLFDFAGINSSDRSTATDAQGRYRVPGLPPGAYRLQVTVRFPYYTTMRYPGIECLQPADCLPNSGSSVTVDGSAVVDNLGFELTPGAVLTGRITEQATGAPVPGIEVRAYQNQIFIGTIRVASATTGADGRYAVTNIPIEYATRLGTANSAGYVDLGWPAAPCNTPDCVEGSSIAALSGVSTAAYDFAITAGRAISGEITIPGAAPGSVPGEVSIYRQVGTQMVPVWTGAISVGQSYTTRGLAAGAYFARARLGDACLAYAQQNCTAFQLPDAATATPIVLPAAIGTYPGVDFAFPTITLFGSGFESVGASTPPAAPARSPP